jgi:alkylated DNA repair dioxygenase AlkB
MSTLSLPFEASNADAFAFHEVVAGHGIWIGRLPARLVPDERGFDELWETHPREPSLLMIHGRLVRTPRWTQSYGHAYDSSGLAQPPLPIPARLEPLFRWARSAIDPRLNGIGVNWYDARRGHYIGAHRDHREGLIAGAPLATIAFGEERPFRVRPWKGRGYLDFASPPGTVFVMPYATNLVATHEVPLLATHHGRRISLTMRAFRPSVTSV